MNAAAILAIPIDEPERLFGATPDHIAARYRELVKRWHPDAGGDVAVFQHIGDLYRNAGRKVASGVWTPPGLIEITDRHGKRMRLQYRVRRKFELGETLIGNSLVTYVIPRAHEALVMNGLQQIGRMRYPNETFRKSLEQARCPGRISRSLITITPMWRTNGRASCASPRWTRA